MFLISIQYLRAIAAAGVVLHHLRGYLTGGPESAVAYGAHGVDLFFVISGFLMWVVASGSRPTPGVFFLKRLARIAPLYWVLTCLAAAASVTSPHFSVQHFLASIFFFPMEDPEWGMIAPILVVGWTLNYEIAFYVLFAFSLALNAAYRFWTICSVIVFLFIIGLLIKPSDAGFIEFYTGTIIIEFVFGLLLGRAFLLVKEHPYLRSRVAFFSAVTAICLGIFLSVLWHDHSAIRGLAWGAPAALIFMGALMLEPWLSKRPIRLLSSLGDASYSTYLTHSITIKGLVVFTPFLANGAANLSAYGEKIGIGWPVTISNLAIASVFLVACHCVGVIVFYFVESPLSRRAADAVKNIPPRFAKIKQALTI